MNEDTLKAFGDELSKIAGIGNLWNKFLDIFRTEDGRIQRRVDYHFSPKAGPDKWDKFVRNSGEQKFVDQVAKHPGSDDKLQTHAQSMHDLSKGTTVGKIWSSKLPGRSYEIKKLPEGFGCTCGDWRFKGSVNPGYECKHIVAYKAGKLKAED